MSQRIVQRPQSGMSASLVAVLGLASRCLPAVDVERLAGDERCSLEVEDLRRRRR